MGSASLIGGLAKPSSLTPTTVWSIPEINNNQAIMGKFQMATNVDYLENAGVLDASNLSQEDKDMINDWTQEEVDGTKALHDRLCAHASDNDQTPRPFRPDLFGLAF